MHQKKSEIHSWKETNFNQNPLPPLFLPKLNPKIHPQFQIPEKNSLNLPTHQTQQFQDELNFKNPSTSKTPLFSTPHKRLILMSQNPSTLSHSPSISSLHHYHFPTSIIPAKSSFSYFPCSFSFLEPLLAAKTILLKLIHHPLLISTLLFLPSLYFFSSNNFPHFLFVIIFSAVILISLKFFAPFPPSIRLLLAQSLSSKTPSKFHPPVVWSIGSKPKSEKRPNSGSWVQVHRNGDVYEGEFYRGKCSGSGVYYYYMSGRYEGDWVDEKYDGYGVETWAKGSRYRGQYRQGLRHGFGVYRFYTGDVYAGKWCNGQSHGCGAHTCEDGSRYVGEFKWGVKHGLGNYHFRNGDTYSGEYFADKMHGFGVYRFAHGHRYEGAWHEGRRQGFGLYTFKNGETQLGHWENGVLNVSSTANNLNGSPFSVGNSRILIAVQEATRAAEKAVNVVKVEDRVKKIVAAATRAANAARVAAVKAVQNQMHQIIPAIYNHRSFNLAKQRENDDI